MWRQITRRALLHRHNSVKHHTILPIHHHETIAFVLPFVEYPSHLSKKPHLCSYARFISSNPVRDNEDLPIVVAGGSNSGLGFSAANVFDESTKSDPENEDFVFDIAVDNLDLNEGLGLELESTTTVDEHAASVEVSDESIEEVRENDPEKVEGLLSLLQSQGDASKTMEGSFEALRLFVDEGLVLKVLETPYVSGQNLIDFFGWVVNKPEFRLSGHVVDALVKVVCLENSTKELYALWDLLKEIGEKEKGAVSTESLNGLIEVFSKLGKGKVAYDVFIKFEELGCPLNADTYYFTIEALCKRSLYDWASLVCEKMLNDDKLPDNADKFGKIISNLCKGAMAKEAHLVYLYAKDNKIYPSQSSVDFLICSLSRIERSKKKIGKEVNKELDRETISLALGLLKDYPTDNRKYANRPFASVVKKLCWIEEIDQAKKLLLEMIDSGPPPGNDTFNCVINGLTKVGDMNEAMGMLQLMKGRGLKPDVYTYSVIMSGYSKAGELDKACRIFDEAKEQHSKLTPVTYHTLIRGFCKLDQFDKAVNLVREMKQHGVNPSHDEYNKLIKSLCFKALDWETAEKLREEMEENGVILNGRTSALIRAVKELKEEASTQ